MISFNEKCDNVLLYLKKSLGQHKDAILPTRLDELEKNTGISFTDNVLNFLANDKKYIERTYSGGWQHFHLTPSGMAFISHSSFVKEQEKLDSDTSLKWYQTENAKKIFEDYPNVNRRSKTSLYLSWFAVGLTVIGLLLKWKCSM